jgi:2-polyprenyl-3-methyl-5-hydroxy-6-metoxy-1,4-benzoquinol methylase
MVQVIATDDRWHLIATSGCDGTVLRAEGGGGRWAPRFREVRTDYSMETVREIASLKGPAWAVDEIARECDRSYLEQHLDVDLCAFVEPDEVDGRRVLDFGCGCGSSTLVLSRLYPRAEVVGLDIEPEYLRIARLRAAERTTSARFFCSSPEDPVPPDHGRFGVAVMCGVVEHLLPEERSPVLAAVWRALDPGGVLFIHQTPHRWFPWEPHTTLLPGINYLPDVLARRVAMWSPRIRAGVYLPERGGQDGWQALLRAGVRGATTSEIVSRLRTRGADLEVLRPCRLGISDEVELWYRGPTFEGYGRVKRWVRNSSKVAYRATGHALVPYISAALRKNA